MVNRRSVLMAMVLLGAWTLQAQKWSTRTGHIEFEASMPGFEAIHGISDRAAALTDLEKREIAVLLRVKEIEFPNDLMQKHFNENYMDSDTYPRMSFTGSWEGELGHRTPVELSGELKIRSVKRRIELPMKSEKRSGEWVFSGSFELRPEDYGVKVPKIVRMKIAEVARVSFELPLKAMD